MNILYLITKSNFGGAQKYVFELAVATKAAGHTVSVACGGTGTKQATSGLLVEKLETVGIATHRITHFMRDVSGLEDIRAFFEIVSLLRRERPDVFHVTSSKAGALGALAGRLTSVPCIVFTSHGLTMDETWRPWWQRKLITFLTWLTIRLAHKTIMISTETYDRSAAMPFLEERVELVFNGVSPIAFQERKRARESLVPELPKNAFLLGGVGELHPNKNWHSLINAVARLPEQVHVCIIGSGEEAAALKKQITSLDLTHRVHLAGYLDAAPLLKAFDIFVLPSKKEGLPYVLLEAGLAELPVVASDLPGNHDIIESGESGLLITPDPTTLSLSLEMLIRDQGMQKRFAENLHRHVTSTFSLNAMVEKTLAVYSSVE